MSKSVTTTPAKISSLKTRRQEWRVQFNKALIKFVTLCAIGTAGALTALYYTTGESVVRYLPLLGILGLVLVSAGVAGEVGRPPSQEDVELDKAMRRYFGLSDEVEK